MFCSVRKQSESDREPNYRFCKKSLTSGKRINTVPVFGDSRNNTLLVDSGQDSVVLAQAFESSRFPLEQARRKLYRFKLFNLCATGRSSCCSLVSNLTSPGNERTCIRIWCTAGAVQRRSQMFVHRSFRFSLSLVPRSTKGLFTG